MDWCPNEEDAIKVKGGGGGGVGGRGVLGVGMIYMKEHILKSTYAEI